MDIYIVYIYIISNGSLRLHHETLVRLSKKALHKTHKIALPGSQTNLLKSAPRHNQSEPTCPKSREGCASMRKRYQTAHRAITRAISRRWPRHSESDPRDIKIRAAPQQERCDRPKSRGGCGFQPLFCRGLRRTAPATKNEPKANRGPHFVRACAVEIHMDISEEAVYARIYNENAADQDRDNPAALIVCEPAQSKCTWTSHKGTFMREFTAKMPWPRWSTLI